MHHYINDYDSSRIDTVYILRGNRIIKTIYQKTCTKCRKEFPATTDFFYKGSGKYNLRADCKECFRKHSAQRYEKNMKNIDFRAKEKVRCKIKDSKRRQKPEVKKQHAKYERFRKQILREKVKEEYGKRCWICGKELNFEGAKKRKGASWARHHISYAEDKTILVCVPCHMWLHGQMRVYKHVIKEKYPTDIAPYVFAKRVVDVYETFNPDIKDVELWEYEDLLNSIRAQEYLTDEEINTILLETEMKRQF